MLQEPSQASLGGEEGDPSLAHSARCHGYSCGQRSLSWVFTASLGSLRDTAFKELLCRRQCWGRQSRMEADDEEGVASGWIHLQGSSQAWLAD